LRTAAYALNRQGEFPMSTLPLSAVDAGFIAAARREHPAVFPSLSARLPMWVLWTVVIAYLAGSLWYFEIWKLASASERAWRLISAMFSWQDMANWQYQQIYVGIAQTLAMAFLGTVLASMAALVIGF